MKRLELEISKHHNNTYYKYYVLLYNRHRVDFENKKDAEKYLRNLKKLLFDNVGILCDLHAKINSLSKQYYFQISSCDNRFINRELHSFDEQLDYVFKDYGVGNSSFVYSKIFSLFNCLSSSVSILQTFAKSKNSHATLVAKCNSILKELTVFSDYYESELFNRKNNINYRSPVKIVHLKNDHAKKQISKT